MIVFVAVLMAAVSFIFIAYPFFKKRAPVRTLPVNERRQVLDSRKDTTYSMLKELEFDYHSGLLSESDYRDLEDRYKKKAISILKEEDQAGKPASRVDDDIEKAVQRMRQQKATRAEDEIEQQVRRLRQSPAANTPRTAAKPNAAPQNKTQFCPQCGTNVQPNDRFCPKCGAKLAGGKRA